MLVDVEDSSPGNCSVLSVTERPMICSPDSTVRPTVGACTASIETAAGDGAAASGRAVGVVGSGSSAGIRASSGLTVGLVVVGRSYPLTLFIT